VSENPVTAAERHPIQNLLDEVDEIIIGVPVPDGNGGVAFVPAGLDIEVKNHIKDMIMSGYATGIAKGGSSV
jgi:hypothetical protein